MLLVGVIYLTLPALAIFLCNRYGWAKKAGAVVLCYLGGVLSGQLIPVMIDAAAMPQAKVLQDQLMAAAIAFALPMMLLSVDLKQWLRLGPTTMLAMGSSMTAVVAMSFLAGWLLQDTVADAWKLVGLHVALYTGGTPNLAAAKESLLVDNNLFLQVHTYDTLLTMGYILLLVSVAQRVALTFLPSFQQKASERGFVASTIQDPENPESYHRLLQWPVMRQLLGASVLTCGLIGCVVLVADQVGGDYYMAVVMVGLTVAALAASLIKRVREIPQSFELGMYVILCFCVVVGSMIDAGFIDQINPGLAWFVLIVVFGSLALHALFCRFLNIDSDTFIITSVAAICSPPFVPMVATALKNKAIVLSGITAGVVGYALANILAISSAYIFKSVFP